MTSDLQRSQFLDALAKSDILLSDWEESFLNSWRQSGSLRWFTGGRRKHTDLLWHRLGNLLTPPMPLPWPLGTHPD